jgi:hypothetical protein
MEKCFRGKCYGEVVIIKSAIGKSVKGESAIGESVIRKVP